MCAVYVYEDAIHSYMLSCGQNIASKASCNIIVVIPRQIGVDIRVARTADVNGLALACHSEEATLYREQSVLPFALVSIDTSFPLVL